MIKGDDWGRLPLELPLCLSSVRYLKSHLPTRLMPTSLWYHPYACRQFHGSSDMYSLSVLIHRLTDQQPASLLWGSLTVSWSFCSRDCTLELYSSNARVTSLERRSGIVCYADATDSHKVWEYCAFHWPDLLYSVHQVYIVTVWRWMPTIPNARSTFIIIMFGSQQAHSLYCARCAMI